MHRFLTYIIVILGLAGALSSCKTTEANYREAYRKTMEGRAAEEAVDSTIYGKVRRQYNTATIDTPDGPVEVRRQLVRVVDGQGATPESLKRYCIVAAQFKQLFNAKSMRDRLADAGYPGAFIVSTAEPMYYIVAFSTPDAAEAAACLKKIETHSSIALKSPCPYILDAAAARRK